MITNQTIQNYSRGVYVLIHLPTKMLYVGSSKNLYARCTAWKFSITHNEAPGNFPSTNHDEYEFRVIKFLDGAELEELRDEEAKVFDAAENAGVTLLNEGRPLRAMTYGVNGVSGTASFHAKAYGKRPSLVLRAIRFGQTIEQALGLAAKPCAAKPRANTREPRPIKTRREMALQQMTVKLIAPDGRIVTYDEAAQITGRSPNNMRRWVERQKGKAVGITELRIEPRA